MTEDWKNKKEAFDAFDGRSEAWNFLPVVLKRAEKSLFANWTNYFRLSSGIIVLVLLHRR